MALLVSGIVINVSAAMSREDASATRASAPIVIRNRDEMQAFIESPAFEGSPLASLSRGGLKRFVAGLNDGHGGFSSLDPSDLQAELSSSQIDAVFRLMGAEALVGVYVGNDQPHARYAMETDFEQRFTALNEVSEPLEDPQNRRAFRKLFDELFPDSVTGESLMLLNNHDLALAFRALKANARLRMSADATDHLLLSLRLLTERDALTDTQIAAVHNVLVAERRFSEAESLENDFADVELTPVPRHRELGTPSTNGPTLLSVFDNGNGLQREALPLDQGLRIVVVASCHFSQDAARAIKEDPRLDKLFREHATWLASADESFGNVANWNSEFPSQPIHIAWSDDEWSMLDSWAMPTFYVFRDGENIAQWAGWPADTGMQTLREQLDAAGVEY